MEIFESWLGRELSHGISLKMRLRYLHEKEEKILQKTVVEHGLLVPLHLCLVLMHGKENLSQDSSMDEIYLNDLQTEELTWLGKENRLLIKLNLQ